METAMVNVATGVMRPLLGKLSTILAKEYSKLKDVRDEIVFLQDELHSMNAFLEKLADMDNLDVQVKDWRNQVRELAYDIEDCIDDFMHQAEHSSNIEGFLKKFIDKLRNLRHRHNTAQQIQKLKARVVYASERHKRYNLDGAISSSTGLMPIDPRLSALYDEAEGLVGLDAPKEELIKILTHGEGESMQKLKVISIVGFGGSGKTTLANQVYKDLQLQVQFECWAFVSVSQSPDMIRIFCDILSQVKKIESVPAGEPKDLIDEIRGFIQDKRYFIIIDDLWEESKWRVIRNAFPENNRCSRVITTTRIETVAKACCGYHHEYIYKMKSLSNQDSRRLFVNRIFGSEDACPTHLESVLTKILKKCGGLPLAIITIASLLASQESNIADQWKLVQNSLGTIIFEKASTLEDMGKILNLSYINLPCYLKTCFLYIGIYPEDYIIRRDDLVRQWVTEGFVSKVEGCDAEDIAESYFNQLVNRSMIQLVYTGHKQTVSSCKVHDMMLELIIHKCREENFLTIVHDPKDKVTEQQQDKIRRLSLRFDCAKPPKIPSNINLSQVRSLVNIRRSNHMQMLPLSKFQLLRVLILDFLGTSSKTAFDLTGMCGMFRLRYFKIRSRTLLQLPTQIRRLRHLETLELDVGSNIDIPSDIVHLPCLVHLIIPLWTKLPEGIGNMKSLQTLERLNLDNNSLENVKGLGELTNLRYLHICFSGRLTDFDSREFNRKYVDVLCSALGKIASYNLKYLSLYSYGGTIYCDSLSCLSPSPCQLQRLRLHRWWFSKVPKWIGELLNLETLRLEVRELSKDDIHILAHLPILIHLHLSIQWITEERIVICGTAFPVLKHFAYVCKMPSLVFEAGAMPRLQQLSLSLDARNVSYGRYGDQNVLQLDGIEHLSGLKEINIQISSSDALGGATRLVESQLRSAVAIHPCSPRVNIDFTSFNWDTVVGR